MANDRSLDEALGRIAAMLGGSAPTATTTAGNGGSNGGAVPRPMAPTGTGPTTAPATMTSDAQKAELAALVFYCMSVPPITQAQLLQMEAGLPDVVTMLRTLDARPSVKNELQQAIEGMLAQSTGERSEGDARVASFVDGIRRDAFGDGERVIPLIALGIAAFGLGYSVVHTWKT